MNEFSTKELSDLIYDKLSTINEEVVLENPSADSVFPCRTIHTPLEVVLKTENAVPIKKRFQVTISHWNDRQRDCMEMSNATDLKLRELNFVRTNSIAIIRDEIVQKYRFDATYEVYYNGIDNSFYFIN